MSLTVTHHKLNKTLVVVLSAVLFVGLAPSPPAVASNGLDPIDVASVALVFPNTQIVGENAAVGFEAEYPEVATVGGVVIGADIKVKELANIVEEGSNDCSGLPTSRRVSRVDRFTSSGSNDPVLTRIRVCEDTDGWVELEVNFFTLVGGVKTPQPLENLNANFIEINRAQYVWAYDLDSYRVPTGSLLTVDEATPDVTKFFSPAGTTATLTTGSAEVQWTQPTDSVTFRFGMDRTVAPENTTRAANLVFEFARGTFFPDEPTTSSPEARKNTVVDQPAIALTPSLRVGEVACGREVVANGEGLKAGSPYSLSLDSSLVLSSGTVKSSAFETLATLPLSLSTGSHMLTLSAVGEDGGTLTLQRAFSVDTDCVVVSLDAGAGSRLAATGPSNTGAVFLGGLMVLTLGLGLIISRSIRRPQAAARTS